MSASASILAGLTLLVIGESHMTVPGFLREPLHASLTAQGAKVHSIGACGASPSRWLKAQPVDCGADQAGAGAPVVKSHKGFSTTAITDLIRTDKPDLVVVIIGDTMGSYDKPSFAKTWAWQEVTGLTKAIASTNTACVWVGPAWGTPGGKYFKNDARVQQLSHFLSSNVAPCDYVDSLKFSKPGQWTTVDGQHLTQSSYASWSRAITNALLKSTVVNQIKKKQ